MTSFSRNTYNKADASPRFGPSKMIGTTPTGCGWFPKLAKTDIKLRWNGWTIGGV
jgi:hypothetical protein